MIMLVNLLCVVVLLVPHHAVGMLALPSRLHQAIQCGDLNEVQSLMAEREDPNSVCYLSARTPLETAATFKRPVIIEYLLTQGASVTDDIVDRLLRSSQGNYTIEDVIHSLKILLEAGAQTNPMDDIAKGYLLPVMLAHSDYEKAHGIITSMISGSLQKIA